MAAIAALSALGVASPAHAATTYLVSNAGPISVTQQYGFTLVDMTSTAKPKIVCTGFSAGGTAKAGAHAFAPPTYSAATASIDAAVSLRTHAFSGCTNSIFGDVPVSTDASPWQLGVSALTPAGGSGYLAGITAHLRLSTSPCTFDLTGALAVDYSNGSGHIAGRTTPYLGAEKVTSGACKAIGLANGDKFYLAGQWTATPAPRLAAD